MVSTDHQRRALLGAVHIKAKQLGLDDAARRAYQQQVTGRDSCKEMSDGQLRYLLAQMDKGKPAGKGGRDGYRKQHDARARKVAAMWHQLAEEGVIQSAAASSLNRFVLRQVGISALDWVRENSDFDALIIALRHMAKRHGVALHE